MSMHRHLRSLLALLIATSAALSLTAHDHAAPDKPDKPDAAWLAQAKAAYPLKTCVVSEEEIGGPMGEGIDYIYKDAGKPDRLVRFCCKSCRKDFDKDPAKYLQMIDQAAAKKAKKP